MVRKMLLYKNAYLKIRHSLGRFLSLFLIIAIACLFGLTPSRIADDLLNVISPKDSLRDEEAELSGIMAPKRYPGFNK